MEEAKRKSLELQQHVKEHGLGADLSKQINTGAFLRSKMKGN